MSHTPSTITQKIQVQRQAILSLAEIYGASNLRIFGSVARGEDTPTSDLDLIIDLEPNRSLFDLGGLAMDLQALLGCSVDIVTEKGLKQRIRTRVLQEAINL
jgi:predicted nucleotidyltransferase